MVVFDDSDIKNMTKYLIEHKNTKVILSFSINGFFSYGIYIPNMLINSINRVKLY